MFFLPGRKGLFQDSGAKIQQFEFLSISTHPLPKDFLCIPVLDWPLIWAQISGDDEK